MVTESPMGTPAHAPEIPPVIASGGDYRRRSWYTLSANNPHHREYSTRKLNDPKWQGQPDQKLSLEVQAESENALVIVLTENFFRSYRGKSQEFRGPRAFKRW